MAVAVSSGLAAALIWLAAAAVLSLLSYLPISALAETAAPEASGKRGCFWLAGLLLPVVGGAAVGVWAVSWATHLSPLASPWWHQSKHVCFRPLLQGADVELRARLVAGAAGLVILAAVVRTAGVLGSTLSVRRKCLRSAGLPSEKLQRALDRLPEALRPSPEAVHELRRPERNSMCLGLWRTDVVVTSGLVKCTSDEELVAVLAHEMMHARRRDNLWGIIATLCGSVLIFVPTALLFWRRWRRDAELACDTAAVAAAGGPAPVLSAFIRVLPGGEGLQNADEVTPAVLTAAAQQEEFGAERLMSLYLRTKGSPETSEEERARPTALRLVGAGVVALAVGGLVLVAWNVTATSLKCLAQSLLSALG